MSAFCTQCGASLAENAKFCKECGAAMQPVGTSSAPAAEVPAAGAPTAAPPPRLAPKRSTPVLKILLILLGLFFLLFLVALGSCFYVGYRVKKKAEQFTSEIEKSGGEGVEKILGGALGGFIPIEMESCSEIDEAKARSYLAADSAARIPLVPGLTLVNVWTTPDGDVEILKQIDSVAGNSVSLSCSGRGMDLTTRRLGEVVRANRTLCREDLQNGRVLVTEHGAKTPEVIRGATMFSFSRASLHDLKTKGSTSMEYWQKVELIGVEAFTVQGKSSWQLARVEPASVPLAVIVNGERVELPAVHAKGPLDGDPTEAYILDDLANPLALQLSNPKSGFEIKMTKITYPTERRIEQQLAEQGRAEVYGIYFDFNSAELRPESDPVLKEIADLLGRNLDWKLSVEGHTDNIGGDAFNQELSMRRATAVQQALAERYQVAVDRLSPVGHGASRPKTSNETIEGRALNRRVELVRQ